DNLDNARSQALDGPGRERLADERAQARVVRSVLKEHAEVVKTLEDPHIRARVSLEWVDGRGPVSEQVLDIVLASENPPLDDIVIVHRFALAQAREGGVWIAAKRRIERSEFSASRDSIQGIVWLLTYHRANSMVGVSAAPGP